MKNTHFRLHPFRAARSTLTLGGPRANAMSDEYKRLFRRHIGREPTQGDGYSDEELTFHEHRLELRLPEAMRTYYRSVGRNEQFNRSHNELVAPQDLERDGEIVVFMVESQAVVSWGVRTRDLVLADPEVWQLAACNPSEAYSEGLPFSRFIVANIDWQFGQASVEPPN